MNDPVELGLEWYRKMIEAQAKLLSPEERAQLLEWEKENLGREGMATSDWPGWERHIGSPPWRGK